MNYIAFETAKGEIFICTKRAARNMAFQEFTTKQGDVNIKLELVGQVSNFIKNIAKWLTAVNKNKISVLPEGLLSRVKCRMFSLLTGYYGNGSEGAAYLLR